MINSLTYISFIFIAFFLRKRKVVIEGCNSNSKGLLTLVVLWGIWIFYRSVDAYDALGYAIEFENAEEWLKSYSSDHLSFYLMILIKKLGGSYQLFRLVCGVFYFIPILYVVNKSKLEKILNRNLYIALNLIYPFFISVVTLRNTLASAVVMLSLLYYFQSKKHVKDNIITILGIVLAMMLHDSAVFYLLFFCVFLVLRKNKKYLRKLTILLLLIDTGIIVLIKSGVLNDILFSLVSEATNVTLLKEMLDSGYGFILFIFFQCALIYLLYRVVKNHIIKKDLEEGQEEIYTDIMLFNIAMLILLPLYAVNSIFFRLFRNILMINNIVFCGNEVRRKVRVSVIILYIIYFLWDSGFKIWEGILM